MDPLERWTDWEKFILEYILGNATTIHIFISIAIELGVKLRVGPATICLQW